MSDAGIPRIPASLDKRALLLRTSPGRAFLYAIALVLGLISVPPFLWMPMTAC